MDNSRIEDLLQSLGDSPQSTELSAMEIQEVIRERQIHSEKYMRKQIITEITLGLVSTLFATVCTAAQFPSLSAHLGPGKMLVIKCVLALGILYVVITLWAFIRMLTVPNSIRKDNQIETYINQLSTQLSKTLKWYYWSSNVFTIAMIVVAAIGLSSKIYITLPIIAASFMIIPLNKWYINKRFGSTIELINKA